MDILNALTKKKFSYDFNRLKKKGHEQVVDNIEETVTRARLTPQEAMEMLDKDDEKFRDFEEV